MQVTIQRLKDKKFSAQAGSHKIIIDAHNAVEGMSPLEVFLTSLGACAAVYTVKYCENAHISTEGLEVSVSGDLGQNKPIRFENIDVKINLKQDIGARKNSLLEFVKNCPVHNTLSRKPEINISI